MDRLVLALAPTGGSALERDAQRGRPLGDYLAQVLGSPVEIVAEPSYAACMASLRDGRIDCALVGEAAALLGRALGAVERLVIPVGADGAVPEYQSVMVTRRDSGVHDLSALRGGPVGLVDEQSLSGYLMPRSMLREAGLDPDADISVRLYQRHRLVADAVLAGEVVAGGMHAGAARPPSLDAAARYARLRVLATSRPIPRGPVVVRHDLPPDVRARLAAAFLNMHRAAPAAAAILNVRADQRFTLAASPSTPTLKSIAALAGVSYATVSRVINASGPVAPATAKRVAAIVDELGYRPNGHALTLQGQRAPLVGLLTPLTPDAASLSVADVLRPALAAAGVPLVLCQVEDGVDLDRSPFLDLLLEGRMGALVVTDRYARDPALARIARSGHVVAVVGAASATPGMLAATHAQAAAIVLRALGRTTAGRTRLTRLRPAT